MKVKITTQAEQQLKELFDILSPLHNKGFSEALERGMWDIIIETKQTDHIKQAIDIEKSRLAFISQRITRLEELQEKLKEIDKNPCQIENKGNGNNSAMEELRNDFFEKNKESILKLYPDISYDKVLVACRFASKKDAQVWMHKKVMEVQE